MIEVERLSKSYGELKAIEGVTFRVEKGEILGFLGPNAAGKTTTMRILTCFFPPTSGEAKVAGYDVFTQSVEVRKRIGYMPENVALYREMRVDRYLDFVAEAKGVYQRSERRRQVADVMEKCGLQAVQSRIIGHVSKGYLQRVGIAQALLGNPEVLILDEPTVGLDPAQIVVIRKLIKSLGREHTVILSTHILPEVSVTCDRVAIINKGRIVVQDTLERLSSRVQRLPVLHIRVRGKQEEIVQVVSGTEGVKDVRLLRFVDGGIGEYEVQLKGGGGEREVLVRRLVEAGLPPVEMRSVGLTLEDVFIQIVTEDASPITRSKTEN